MPSPRVLPAPRHLSLAALCASLLAQPRAASGATFVIESRDPPGVGFEDRSPAAPLPGNPATTRGEQALAAVRYAAEKWGAALDSDIPIRVAASFAPLPCAATSGALGSAAPHLFARNARGLLTNVWYPVALANRLVRVDLAPDEVDVDLHFNGAAGTPGCLENYGFYLGLDANPGANADLATLVLHELAHGLGATTEIDLATGALRDGSPDVFSLLLYDERKGKVWPELTDAERKASAASVDALSWAGPAVTEQARDFLATGRVVLSAGAPIDGELSIGLARFGPTPSATPVGGALVGVNDGVGAPGDGCEDAAPLAGGAALIEAGGCTDVDKVLSAQTAGATLALVVDDRLTLPPLPLQGPDGGRVTIPSVRVTQADAARLRPLLGTGVVLSLRNDPERRAGTSAGGRLLLHAPDPLVQGSSVTHFTTSATPDLLMEPAPRVGHDLDLTVALLEDIGWRPFACGDGVVEGSEECEPDADAGAASCLADCRLPSTADASPPDGGAELDAADAAEPVDGTPGSGGQASRGGTTGAGGAHAGEPGEGGFASRSSGGSTPREAGASDGGKAHPHPDRDSGCGCFVGQPGEEPGRAWSFALAALAAFVARRSRPARIETPRVGR